MRPDLYATDHQIGVVSAGVILRLLSVEVWSDRIFLRICADEESVPQLPDSSGDESGTSVDVQAFHDLTVDLSTGEGTALPLFYRQVGGTGLEWTSTWGFRIPGRCPAQITLDFQDRQRSQSTMRLALRS